MEPFKYLWVWETLWILNFFPLTLSGLQAVVQRPLTTLNVSFLALSEVSINEILVIPERIINLLSDA